MAAVARGREICCQIRIFQGQLRNSTRRRNDQHRESRAVLGRKRQRHHEQRHRRRQPLPQTWARHGLPRLFHRARWQTAKQLLPNSLGGLARVPGTQLRLDFVPHLHNLHFQPIQRAYTPESFAFRSGTVPLPYSAKFPATPQSPRTSVAARSSKQSPRAVPPAAPPCNASPPVPPAIPAARDQTMLSIPIHAPAAATSCDGNSTRGSGTREYNS